MDIPEAFHDLFRRETFATFVSLLPDGTAHAVPVWVDYDGTHVLTSASVDSRRHRNVTADPRVTLSVRDPDNPYRAVMVRGEVVEITDDGLAYNDRQARNYWNVTEFPHRDEEMVVHRTRPEQVVDASSSTPDEWSPA